MKTIIAVVGMCGSGKSVACEFFKKNSIPGIYFGGVTLAQMERLNLEKSQENEKKIREQLRQEHGMAAFAILSIDQIKACLETNQTIFIDGLYSFEEFEILDQEFPHAIVILEIYLDKHERYLRLSQRKERSLSQEQAVERDLSEIKKLNKGGPIAFSDYKISNHGSVEELETQLRLFLDKINQRN